MITHGKLHHAILQFMIDSGYAPSASELALQMNHPEGEIITALYALADYHGLVLHPHEPKIWVIHPFATAPTNFVVSTDHNHWWGNCAWCSLGVAALLHDNVTISTRLGGETESVELHIQNGQLLESDFVVHFPVPMQQAWDNVMYTCSVMLLFQNEAQVDSWCNQHRIPKGDVQPLQTVWKFAQVWYGNHLNPLWEKWTVDEARQIFARFGFTHPIWQMPASDEHF